MVTCMAKNNSLAKREACLRGDTRGRQRKSGRSGSRLSSREDYAELKKSRSRIGARQRME